MGGQVVRDPPDGVGMTSPVASLEHAIASLALDSWNATDDGDGVDDDARYRELVETMVEEIVNDQGAELPTSDADQLTTEELLSHTAYDGSVDDRAGVLEFLTAEVQAIRISNHRAWLEKRQSTESRPPSEASDASIARSISRICAALGVGAGDIPVLNTPDDVVEFLEKLCESAVETIAASDTGEPLLDDAMVSQLVPKMGECERMAESLAREHTLRRALILRRLEVTIQSFAMCRNENMQSDESQRQSFFDHVLRKVTVEIERADLPVSLFDAFAAREWLLEVEQRTTGASLQSTENNVKRVLMGEVPDRGGRIGQAAKAKEGMPSFRPRSNESGGGQGRRGKGRGKSHGKGRKR